MNAIRSHELLHVKPSDHRQQIEPAEPTRP